MKKYFKKSLSVFLAVLMLMSCWVFVAPQKAEAASAGNYTVRVKLNVTTQCASSNANNTFIKIKYKPTNGTGNETGEVVLYRSSNTTSAFGISDLFYTFLGSTGTKELPEATIPGFPTYINMSVQVSGASLRNCNATATLQVKTIGTDNWTDIVSTNVTFSNVGGVINPTRNNSASISNNNLYPKATSIDIQGPAELNVPAWGASNATATFSGTVKDQYGVNWYQAPTWNYSATSGGTDNGYTGVSKSTTDAADSTTITVTSDAQTANKSTTTDSKNLYVTATCGSAKATKPLTLKNPAYTWTYDVNDPNPATGNITITKNSGTPATATGTYTESKTYYYHPTEYPTNATKPGYIFKGMYTEKNQDVYAFEKDFVAKGTQFTQAAYTAETSATTPPRTFYAAWNAKDITATFEDLDGNKLGTITGKYNRSLAVNPDYDSLIAALNDNAPEYHQQPGTSGTYDYRFVGWDVFDAKDANGNDYTHVIGGQSPDEAILMGDVTFRPVYDPVKSEYTVNFHDTDGTIIEGIRNTYNYKEEAEVPGENLNPVYPTPDGDNAAYVFTGWTTTKPEEGKPNVVDFESKDADGKYIPVTTDFTVRKDAEYYPVFAKSYWIVFKGADGEDLSEGKYYPLGATPEIPADQTKEATKKYTYNFLGWSEDGKNVTDDFTVVKNIIYVPVFEEVLNYYTVRIIDAYFNEDGQFRTGLNINPTELPDKYHVDQTIPVIETSKKDGWTYTFAGWVDDEGNEIEDSIICDGRTDFYYALYERTEAVYDINFVEKDGTTKTVNKKHFEKLTDDEIPTPEKSVFESDGVRYTFDHWEDAEGNEPDVNTQIKSDITYNAVYNELEAVKVTFVVNGVTTYETTAFPGDKVDDVIDKYPYEDPTMADDLYTEKNEFIGWADSNGDPVDKVPDSDFVLEAQFRGSWIEYKVTFKDEYGNFLKDENGKDLENVVYHYGDKLNVPDTNKEDDLNYSYTFSYWEPADPTVCRGNATYTAHYNRTRIFYEVTFLNDDGSTIKTQKYINGARIIPPVAPGSDEPIEEGFSWKFVGWTREDGTMFNGDKIDGKNVVLKAVYEKVGADCDIIFVVEGEATTVPVKYGEKLESAAFNAEKLPDETGHYKFVRWLDKDGKEVPLSTVITEAMTLYAEFEKHDHNLVWEVLDEPTFFEEGRGFNYCEDCGYTFDEQEIPVLEDNIEPNGQLIIGRKIWNGPTDLETEDLTVVSINDIFMVHTNDDAEEDKDFNPDGIGSGVDTIDIRIKVGDTTTEWVNLHTNLLDQPNANATRVLGDIKIPTGDDTYADLSQFAGEGILFAIYIRITDRNGNEYFINSGNLIFDEKAPNIIVTKTPTGDPDAACEKVKVDVEDGTGAELEVTLNGVKVEPDENGYYTEPGTYAVTATDIVGNKSKTTFTINDHDWLKYEKAANCADDGYSYYECKVCDIQKDYEVIKASGEHSYEATYFPGDCETPGRTVYTCKICKDTYTVEEPLADHKFVLKEITKEATCAQPGVALYECEVCHIVKTENLPIDESKHNWKLIERVAPTIYDTGYEKYRCQNCGKVVVTEPGQLPSFSFLVEVTDTHGKPVPNAKVSVYENGALLLTGYTDFMGIDTFLLESGRSYTLNFMVEASGYTTTVSEYYTISGKTTVNITLGGDAHEDDYECTCTCHKDGFFPSIYRFLQKIVKLFTGKAKCCNDPDSRI